MNRPTFLDRRPLGIPNYLAIALLAALVLALVPRGARMALRSNTNNVEDWLPASYSESTDLAWFRTQFGSEAFVLASWEGCTLGDTDRLELLASKLEAEPLSDPIAQAASVAPHADRKLFTRVLTGPQMIDRLAKPPAKIDRAEAIARLEGALIGPVALDADAKTDANRDAIHDAADRTRTTCLIAYLGPYATVNNRSKRLAIERLVEIATTECGINRADLHLGGPPVDNVAIDVEGEKTLTRLAGLSGLVGLILAYACFRSIRLTGMVLLAAIFSAGASLALVFYFGAVEVLVFGATSPRLGKLDAILMSMPAVVYVLSLSGAIHLVNYYRDAAASGGRRGAVERAVRMAWMPCSLAAFTTAIGLASLASSDILPIEKFGLFSAIGIIAALGLLFAIIPIALHRFPPALVADASLSTEQSSLPRWARQLAELICKRHAWVATGAGAIMVLLALGLPRIESSVQLLKLLDSESDLVQDYGWLEAHLGNLVPMEVVIAVPPELRRSENEHPEASGTHYAMTTFERLLLAERIGQRIESLDSVSRVLDAATFAPAKYDTKSPSNRRTHDYVMSRAIDENRDELAEYLRWELTADGVPASEARELWRASARIAALDDIDYGQFVGELRAAVEPVLDTYRQRSELVAALAQRDQHLAGAKICFVAPADPKHSDALFVQLLREAGVNLRIDGHRGRLWATTIDDLKAADDTTRQRLAMQDAVVVLDEGMAERLAEFEIDRLAIVDLSESAADQASGNLTSGNLTAVYTGVVPLVYKTQRELLVSLQESLAMATLLIAIVLILLLRSIGAGLASMIPNLFPIVVVFGALGWLGIKVDIGIMMTASVALGVAVDDTIHFVSWFRRGLSRGLSRRDAALFSYERCGVAMVQTTLIAGLGLAVFAFSTFTPTQQFGYLMVTILTAALVGDLVLLPALLVGPMGRLFPAAKATLETERLAPSPRPSLLEGGPGRGSPATPIAPSGSPSKTAVAIAGPPRRIDDLPSSAEPKPEPLQSEPPQSEPPEFDPPHETLSPANAALRAKLRAFRR